MDIEKMIQFRKKLFKVIVSCKTEAHFKCAEKYTELYLKSIENDIKEKSILRFWK